ncbi:J domain-containing protein [Chloroflexota bacterium]
MTNKDYYAILEISHNASAKEIKRAYRRLARRYHPDLHPGDKFYEEMFKAVNEAYEVLSNPEKRQEYDRLQDELSSSREYYPPSQTDVQVGQVRKNRIDGYLDRFFGWIERIGTLKIALAVLLLIIIIPLAVSIFSGIVITLPPERDASSERDLDHLWIGNTSFQEEVLEAQIPVVVAFCDHAIWSGGVHNEDINAIRVQGLSSIAAIRLIIREGEYENKIKFCVYHWRRDDPVVKTYELEWYPRTIIFTNGEIFKDASLTKGVDNIEVILREVIGKM